MSSIRISTYILLTTLLILTIFTLSTFASTHPHQPEKRMTSAASGSRISPAISSPQSNFMISPGLMAGFVGGLSVVVAGLMV